MIKVQMKSTQNMKETLLIINIIKYLVIIWGVSTHYEKDRQLNLCRLCMRAFTAYSKSLNLQDDEKGQIPL